MNQTLLIAMLGSVVGAVLGLSGAGAGVLAVPLLVFGLHLPLPEAAPMALVAVGLASAVGAGLGLVEGVVRYRAAALIGALGMAVAPLGVWAAHRLPGRPLMAAFAAVLCIVAWRAWRATAADAPRPEPVCRLDPADGRLHWTLPCARALAGTGTLAGFLSGLLGVGGGFVIVPALLRCTDVPMRGVQATSLAVIALVSVSGTAAAVSHGALPLARVLPFAGAAVLTLLLTRPLAKRWPARRLQQIFALVSLAVAALLMLRALGRV